MNRETQLVRMRFGSHVYGTNLPSSDIDYKAVFLPALSDLILQRSVKTSRNRSTGDPHTKNSACDVDEEEFSLQGYMRLLCEGQTIAVDMMFTPASFYDGTPHPVWTEIRRCRSAFLSSGVAAFIGYCRQQANKYGVKGSRMAAARDAVELLRDLPARDKLSDHWAAIKSWAHGREHVEIVQRTHKSQPDRPVAHLSVCSRMAPENIAAKDALNIYARLWLRYGERARQAMDNRGIDWKALMHAARVLGEAEELLQTGTVTFPRPDREHLLRIRLGELPYKAVAEEIEAGMERLPSLVALSCLREKPDLAAAEKTILSAYENVEGL